MRSKTLAILVGGVLAAGAVVFAQMTGGSMTGAGPGPEKHLRSLEIDAKQAGDDADKLMGATAQLRALLEQKTREGKNNPLLNNQINTQVMVVNKMLVNFNLSSSAVNLNVSAVNFERDNPMELMKALLGTFNLTPDALGRLRAKGYSLSEIAIACNLGQMPGLNLTPAKVLDLRDQGKGWAEIAKLLNLPSLNPQQVLSLQKMVVPQPAANGLEKQEKESR